MTKIESNELIARFMGLEKEDDGYLRERNDLNGYDYGALFWYKPENMLYDKSWDWLMPVCEKINSFKLSYPAFMNCSVIIRPNECEIKDGSLHNSIFHFEVYDGNHADKYTTLSATYEVVLQFIKWYNENKVNG